MLAGDADLRATFETNFFAVVELTRLLLPLLEKSRPANIVNVSSVMGSLTIHLADATRDKGIVVQSAHPGWVKTELGTDAAPVEVTDGAKTIVDLALQTERDRRGQFIHQGEPVPW